MMLGKLQVPPTVKKGEPFEVRVLLQHPMETGYRRDMDGQSIPLYIIDKFICRVAGREVMRAEFGSGVAANPYLAFYATADESGEVEIEWADNRGNTGKTSAKLEVS